MEFEDAIGLPGTVISALGGTYQVCLCAWWLCVYIRAPPTERFPFHWGYTAQFPIKISFYIVYAYYQMNQHPALKDISVVLFAAYMASVYLMGVGMSSGLGTRFVKMNKKVLAYMVVCALCVGSAQLLVLNTSLVHWYVPFTVTTIVFSVQLLLHYNTLRITLRAVNMLQKEQYDAEHVIARKQFLALLLIFVALVILFILACIERAMPSNVKWVMWAVFVGSNEAVMTITLYRVKPSHELLDISMVPLSKPLGLQLPPDSPIRMQSLPYHDEAD